MYIHTAVISPEDSAAQKLVITLCNIFKTQSACSQLTQNYVHVPVILLSELRFFTRTNCSCISALRRGQGERNLSHERNLAQELVSMPYFSPWISMICEFTSWKMTIPNKKPIKMKVVATQSSKTVAPNPVLNFIQGTFPLTILPAHSCCCIMMANYSYSSTPVRNLLRLTFKHDLWTAMVRHTTSSVSGLN